MAIELKDWIDVGKSYASGYVTWLYRTLETPWSAQPPSFTKVIGEEALQPSTPAGVDIFVIVAISIFVGATIGATIPDRPPLRDRATVLVVVSLIWLFVGWLIHLVCRLLRGTGSLASSILAIVQVLAAVYVVSNLLTLIIVTAAKAYGRNLASLIPVDDPGALLVTIQCLALLYYVPAALAVIHHFKKLALVIVAIFSALCSLLIFLPIASAGGCAAPDYSLRSGR